MAPVVGAPVSPRRALFRRRKHGILSCYLYEWSATVKNILEHLPGSGATPIGYQTGPRSEQPPPAPSARRTPPADPEQRRRTTPGTRRGARKCGATGASCTLELLSITDGGGYCSLKDGALCHTPPSSGSSFTAPTGRARAAARRPEAAFCHAERRRGGYTV
jgi:hypothetical protein